MKNCHTSFVSLITWFETPCQELTNALDCRCGCNTTIVIVSFLMTSRRVRGPPHRWCFHRVPPATTHDVCSSGQVVTIHRLVHWHALSKVDLCFASLLLGGYCHVLVSLKVALCRLISTRLLGLTSLFNRVGSQV